MALALVATTVIVNVSLSKSASSILPQIIEKSDTQKNIGSPQNLDDPKKIAYMTFDDGPSKNTEYLLSTLEQLDVKATFFVIAHNEEYFDLLTKAKNLGHSIAPHSYSHKYSEIYSSSQNFMADFSKVVDVIEQYCGEVSPIFRFPAGSSNTLYKKYGHDNLLNEIIDITKQNGYRYFDWNIDTRDGLSSNAISAEEIFNNFLKDYQNLSANQPPVILMHDSSVGETSADGARLIIEFLKQQGFSFGTLENCEIDIHHSH